VGELDDVVERNGDRLDRGLPGPGERLHWYPQPVDVTPESASNRLGLVWLLGASGSLPGPGALDEHERRLVLARDRYGICPPHRPQGRGGHLGRGAARQIGRAHV
jgi:hypothetical protein